MSPRTLPSLLCTTALLLAAGIGVNREPTDPTIRSVEGVDVQSVSGEDYMVET